MKQPTSRDQTRRTGLHTRTQALSPVEQFKQRFHSLQTHKVEVLPDDYFNEINHKVWPWRYREAFNWFGLVLLYLGLSFIILFCALVGTRGLILIWEGWLSEVGK